MRFINSHRTGSDLNNLLEIRVNDEKSFGNANHDYVIDVTNQYTCVIEFQKGALDEHELNGISDESLLAILIDRLEGFQSGEFKCRENALALTKMEEALLWLQQRTKNRQLRGVEGRNIP